MTYTDRYYSLSTAVRLAQNSEGHRGWAIVYLTSLIKDTEEDFRQDASELIILLIDRGKLDPSRPKKMVRYVMRSVSNLKKKGWRQQDIQRRAMEKFELLTEYSHIREELKFNDTNLRALQRAVHQSGTTKGAVQAAADSLGITRQTLRRRLRRLHGSLSDYKGE